MEDLNAMGLDEQNYLIKLKHRNYVKEHKRMLAKDLFKKVRCEVNGHLQLKFSSIRLRWSFCYYCSTYVEMSGY